MFFESPWIKVWVAMKFAPLLEPFTAFTTIIFILDSHAVFMGHTQLVWYTCLTLYVLVIIKIEHLSEGGDLGWRVMH